MTTVNIQRMGLAQIDAVPMRKFLEAARRVDAVNGSVVIDGTQYDISTLTFVGGSFENVQGTKLIYVSPGGSDTEGKVGSPVNPYKTITAAYAKAVTLAPAANSPVNILVCPGTYVENLAMNTSFINVISQITSPVITNIGNAPSAMTQLRPVHITGNVTITAAGGYGFIGIDITGNLNLDINPGLINNVIVTGNIISVGNVDNFHFMSDVHTIAAGQFLNSSGNINGVYIGCSSDGAGFAGNTGNASGTFIDCKSTSGSFGLIASGSFTDCTVSDSGFGSGANSQATGTFTRCISQGGASFGFGANTQVSGIFIDCISVNDSFGSGANCVVSGTFRNCFCNGNNNFGSGAAASVSGTFENCKSVTNSFGDSNSVGSIANGFFILCTATDNSFGETAPGTFENCIGGILSFGTLTSSGIFINCEAGSNSFGNSALVGSSASGTFNSCIANDNSFGENASGEFTNCVANSFCYGTLISSGNFFNCKSGLNSFGDSALIGSITSGIFNHCTGTANCFADIGSGQFTDCEAGNNSFGQTTFSGRSENCTGGDNSFALVAGGSLSGIVIDSTISLTNLAAATISGTIDNLIVTDTTNGLFNITVTGVVRNTRIKATNPLRQPFTVGANSKIYNCIFVSAAALDAAAPATPSKIYNTTLNLALGANIANGITTLTIVPQVDAALDF